jgi:Uma2 family endonuclease
MELLTETVLEERQLSSYELERNKPMPSLNHGYLQTKLSILIGSRYMQAYTLISELSLEMLSKPNTVPDIAIYPKKTIDFLHDITTMSEMPITVIEIVSSSQSNDDILAKFERYFLAGVQSCWLVMPSFQAISVYSGIGEYEFFNNKMTLIDPTTNIEIPLNEVFS